MNIKRIWWVIVAVFVFVVGVRGVNAVVDTSQNWLPVQQIAISPSSTTSIDNNMNGVVDNAEALNGLTSNDFLKKGGDTLKGVLFLYYGTGKIVDLDNPNYFLDPSWKINVNSLCVKGECVDDLGVFVKQNSNANFLSVLATNISADVICLGGICRTSWDNQSVSLEDSNNNSLIDLVDESLKAKELEGINNSDLLFAVDKAKELNTSCVGGDCSHINAYSLQGYSVSLNGELEGSIPVVNNSVVYKNLNAGYADYSSLSNQTNYLGNLSANDVNERIEAECQEGQFVNKINNTDVECSSPPLPPGYENKVSEEEMENYFSNNLMSLLSQKVGTCPTGQTLVGFDSGSRKCASASVSEMDVKWNSDSQVFSSGWLDADDYSGGDENAKIDCPEGYVVVGITIYPEDDNDLKHKVIRKIKLRCRKLHAVPYPSTG